MPGAGKSTIANIVAKKLKLKFYSMGNLMRELAAKRGISINEYAALKEDVDSEVDNYQKKIGLSEDNFILEGRLAFHFIPKSIKFFFYIEPKLAAKRIFDDQRGTEKHYENVTDSLTALKKRMKDDQKRYKRLYGIDAYNKNNFDYIIDTTKLDSEGAAEKVIEIIKRYAK